MQLTTPHENINDEETCDNSRSSAKIKHGHRYRRKKIIKTHSEDTVLEFDDNEDFKTRLPDLIQDTDCNDDTTNDSGCDHFEIHVTAYEATQKKFSLPNDTLFVTSKQGQSANTSPDIGTMKKKFSLPCDVSKYHNTNDRYILDVNKLRIKYNSSTSLPSDSIGDDGGSLRKKYNSIDGFEGRCRLDSKVGEFVHEVMSSISEIGNGNPGDGVRKLRGIIKKTLSNEKDETGSNKICIRRREKCKNTVHFSEENITIEIPRPSKPYFQKVQEKMSYYCCFGFLFPNS